MGQIIVLQIFDDIHIPILYNIEILFADGKLFSIKANFYDDYEPKLNYNYHLEFGYSDDVSRYRILWDKLTQPKAFHDIVIVDTIGKISFKGYIANVQDEIVYANPNDSMSRAFQSLSCDLVAKMPSRRAR